MNKLSCQWSFCRGPECGEPATHRTAGGLLLCSIHYTDWARGLYRPIAIDLTTREVRGGITNGQILAP